MAPPPDRGGLKHKGSTSTHQLPVAGQLGYSSLHSAAVPEPTPKRKTVVERAGELPRPQSVASTRPRSIYAPSRAPPTKNARMTPRAGGPTSVTASHGVANGSLSTISDPTPRPASAMAVHRPTQSMAHVRPTAAPRSATPATRPASPQESTVRVTEKRALGKRKAWDTKGRLEDIEYLYAELTEKLNGSVKENTGLEETVSTYKSRSGFDCLPQLACNMLRFYKRRVSELEAARSQLTTTNATIQSELENIKARFAVATSALEDEARKHRLEVEDLCRQHRDSLDATKRAARDDSERRTKAYAEDLDQLRRRLESELEKERSQRVKERQEMGTQAALDAQKAQLDSEMKSREIHSLRNELEQANVELARDKLLRRNLENNLAETSGNVITLESSLRACRAKIEDLESEKEFQIARCNGFQQQLHDAVRDAQATNDKLRNEESLRRKLHNQIQELKGNIRVFCRVRPTNDGEPSEEHVKMAFPDADQDGKEIEILGLEERNSLGNVSVKKNSFTFDRVFAPRSQNVDIFEEISQLVQSALDGYNVCIFCYGQTGSGKTYTMSAEDGMIPRALRQIYDTAQRLQEKGWRYWMEGSFVEVYNENLNDLLGRPEDLDKKKLEIRHEPAKCKTYVTDLTMVLLDSPAKVESILRRASANRSVAATKANERSSRSHSVFMLRMTGQNAITGERSEGTLNLVDLAGSERLSQSGSTGDRLKETQNINRSLSCLGDVIGALGQGKEGGHVPYRNSKLTYLLQFSLGGNSKTLMFVMISPLQAHLSETLTSLKFATKVHNTHIGTAKRQTRVKERDSSS
ncbi:MAG: kinesin-like nuclear fusion protein [Phylliscum demangeonii]|nr:MAG: kinesin-like nuclear fusion protein [Phylliscum demangeonii]